MVELRKICRNLVVVAGGLILAACAGQPTEGVYLPRAAVTLPPAASTNARPGNAVAELALAMVGTPYAYGGAGPDGFDCSGLVYFAYSSNGMDVPRTSLQQFRQAHKIRLTDAGPGDLVFFQDQKKLSHVGIYLGANRFVHAPATGRTVSVSSLSEPYYQMHLVGVGRLADL